jgi:hypothetical protein
MARYTLQIEPHKRQKKLYWAWLQLVLGIVVLLLYLVFDEENTFSRVAHIVIAIFFISNGVSGIKASRRNYYVEINDVLLNGYHSCRLPMFRWLYGMIYVGSNRKWMEVLRLVSKAVSAIHSD